MDKTFDKFEYSLETNPDEKSPYSVDYTASDFEGLEILNPVKMTKTN